MKIYNEVIIDMNTGETIYEDSFEYYGDDLALCCGPPGIEQMSEEQATETPGTTGYRGLFNYSAEDIDRKQRDYGLEALSMDQFYDIGEDGSKIPKKEADILKLILQHKPYNKDIHGDDKEAYENQIKGQINDLMPKLTEPDAKRQAFLDEDKATALGKADIFGEKADLAKQKAEDVYGLGVSAAGRAAGAATEQYGLAMSGAKRGLQSGLGQLQAGAGRAGAQMRGAYGGMGGGMRGAIGGQAAMAKGLESTYGAYTDQQTAATGALGRVQGEFTDEMARLGKERGYATTAYGIAGSEEQAMRDAADLAQRRGEYGLEQEAEGEWEANMGTWLSGMAKKGGYVYKDGSGVGKNSTKTFLDILSELPDAGGS